jgi:hypothetical protein
LIRGRRSFTGLVSTVIQRSGTFLQQGHIEMSQLPGVGFDFIAAALDRYAGRALGTNWPGQRSGGLRLIEVDVSGVEANFLADWP